MAGKVSTASSGSKPEMAGIVAPLDNRFYLFNHFEKPPMDDEAFVGFWMNTAKYVQKQDHLLSMHLHQCIDPESKFQWVNFVVFDSNDVCVFGKPDPEWKRRMQAESDRNMNCYPGQYREISSYNGDAITAALKERPDESRFLLTAVTADDSVSAADLEENWKSWMKTNFIHEQLKGNTNLRDSLLYKVIVEIISEELGCDEEATKSGVVAPLSNRFFLYNFFEEPPVTDKEFMDNYWYIEDYVKKLDHHLSGHLHKAINPHETKFPWVNFAVFDSEHVAPLELQDPEFIKRIQIEKSTMIIRPGEYREIASYNDKALTDEPKERSNQTRFLITAVAADDKIPAEDVEENWKSWMKTEFIYEQLKGDKSLKDSLLYKMVKTFSSEHPLLRYAVRTELADTGEYEGAEIARYLNHLQNMDGVHTYTGFYTVPVNVTTKK